MVRLVICCIASALIASVGLVSPLGCTSGAAGGGGATTSDGDDMMGVEDDGQDNANEADTGDGGLDSDVAPITDGDWFRPGVETTWQWQIQTRDGAAINTSYDVDVYDVDLFDVDESQIAALQEEGRRVVCYFSVGTFEDFREDADAFAPADLGNTLDDFADERWLDVRSTSVHAIMLARLDLAVAKGCDGVEPDNVTAFSNDSGFADITATDQLAYNKFIANAAHERGLSVGLKNDLDQIDALIAYYDFAVNEQCHEFDECQVYDAFIDAGKAVFNAEYLQEYVDDPESRDQICADAAEQGLRTLVLPVDLDDAFRLSCDE